ncbi:hypothetical protein GCM10022237_02320 [Nocardioides ginsengisoli]|uniref:Uncharacterized protein n=1 Tax=Nocardioides ginsengisoli TaxID=363868 RepID=A0ABW3W688_9ACTN
MGKSILLKLGSIAIAIVVALGIFLVKRIGAEKIEEAKAPKVGECVNLTGSSFNADHEEIGCGDALATYKIVNNKGSCDDAEINYTISLGSKDSGNVADLCLKLNAAKGDCFDVGGTTSPAKKVDCATTKGQTNVVVVDSVGKNSDKCAGKAQPVENKLRDELVCVLPNA